MKAEKVMLYHRAMCNVMHTVLCTSYNVIAQETGKYEGATEAQIAGFVRELSETVRDAMNDMEDRIAGELNPSNDHPGAPVTMYYHRETGERIA